MSISSVPIFVSFLSQSLSFWVNLGQVLKDLLMKLEFLAFQVWHRRTFQPSGLFAARVDLHGSTPVWSSILAQDQSLLLVSDIIMCLLVAGTVCPFHRRR